MHSSHADRVAAVSHQIKSRPAGTKLTIRKPTPVHSIRDQRYKAGLHAIDVGALDQILSIDRERRTVTAEGQVTMGQLARATLAEGFLPAVVPEYRQFTISGLINGEGIQSSSHRYGVFTHTIASVELVTADGSLVTASRAANTELLAAVAESLGTLGIVVAATLDLVPAKPFVKLTYRRFRALDDYARAFTESVGQSDFHEGVVFGPDCLVLLTGEFVDEAGSLTIFDVERPGAEYYFQHVRRLAKQQDTTVEVMPTLAYLARGERGLWWMLECHTDFPLLSETEWGRVQLDKQVSAQYARHGFTSQNLTTDERDRCVVNQDMGVRIERLAEGIRWIQERLRVYPIWNCAVALTGSVPGVDLGIYGEPQVSGYRRIRDMRALQLMADAPSLWGVSYFSADELRATFPGRAERYERARQQVNAADAFLHIRDKVVWVDPSAPDPGTIPLWRLRSAYGRRWYLNPLAHLVLGVATISKLIWPNLGR